MYTCSQKTGGGKKKKRGEKSLFVLTRATPNVQIVRNVH